MSSTSEPSAHREALQRSDTSSASAESPLVDETKSSPPSTKRSEVLRHVFPRPPRGTATTRKSIPRVTKPEHRRNALFSATQSSRRVAFHKVITSFFHNTTARVTASNSSGPGRSSMSSIRSRSNSNLMCTSLPSLEVVSPGAFLFSGPSLRSRSDSLSNSTSQLHSFTENGSDGRSLGRVRSESFCIDEDSFLDDGILEPFVEQGVLRSMSDVLLGIATPIEELEASLPENFQEDIQSLDEGRTSCLQRNSPGLDTALAVALLPYLDSASRKTLRSTCRSWRVAIDCVVPPQLPPSFRLPNEILQQLYGYLGPKDFNAARHTCQSWMRASLDKKLLVTMLVRGGWWSGAEADIEKKNHVLDPIPPQIPTSDEWFFSRRLSRECALSSKWTGNGLGSVENRKLMVEASDTDFSDLANGNPSADGRQRGALIFTTSICGQFLLVAKDTLIYIYELRGGNLSPVTSVTCPRRVLSLSMDVSSGRHAAAALLEGRMGMVCELRYGRKIGANSLVEVHVDTHGYPYRTAASASIITSRESDFEAGVDAASRTSPLHRGDQPFLEDEDQTPFDSVDVQSNYQAVTLHEVDDRRTFAQNHINPTWNLRLRGAQQHSPSKVGAQATETCTQTIPIENGTSTFYRHLCSEDDPPRSVSICPQRRCVAFGCSAGIELHWIDALTGQSLSRWFPLTAPSDYLYFLSPRPGFESANKLRLISSAAHPDDRPAISRKFFLGRPTISSFWGSFGFGGNQSRSGALNCDHYHAVPLSDGHHVLFIDPPTGKLFMGCDAPLGGPTKLLRKIMFVPPPYGSQLPRLYTTASDMTWGARVVVAFGDTIMLYSIPPDVCNLSRTEQKAETWDVYKAPPFFNEGRAMDHWLNWWDEPYSYNRWGDDPIWPIAIRGTEIGSLRGVCELAVHTHPDITIWGFTLNSQCKAWQLRNQADPVYRSRRYVCQSGIVHDAYTVDEAKDVIMTDIETPYPGSPEREDADLDEERSVGFDGHSSQVLVKRIPRALSVENDEWVDFLDVRGCDAYYEGNGDVLMYPWDREAMDWQAEIVEETDVGAFAGV